MKIEYKDPVTSFGKNGFVNQHSILIDELNGSVVLKATNYEGKMNALIEIPKDKLKEVINELNNLLLPL